MDKWNSDELAALLRSDVCSFTQRCFHELNPQAKLLMNWHIELVTARLEACRQGKARRLIINIPPRHLKSLCASVALPAFWLGHDPTAQILCASYGQELADKFSRDCRTVMTSDWYRRLFHTRLSPQRQSAQEFVTTRQGFRFATSVGGVLTGRGADVIIIDDPLKPEEALSETQRQAVNAWFDHTLFSRLNDKELGRIIVIMQRLHEDDLVGHLLEQGGWEVVPLPAIAEQDEEHVIENLFGRIVHRRQAGDILHAERESQETLEAIRKRIGEYNFAGQYQQSPAPLGGGLVKQAWFKFYEPNELPEKFDQVVQSWDTANKPSELSDYSACTTWGLKANQIYLLHVLRRRLSYPELKRVVREQRERWRANVVLIEDRASGTQLIQELTYEGLYAVKGYAPEGDKVMRFHAQTAIMENGFVHLPREALWLAEYLHELTTFPYAKHDDQADSTAQALAWIKQAGQEPGIIRYYREEAERRRREPDPGPLVRLKVPSGITHIQLLSRREVVVGNDGTIEISERDAKPLVRAGWVEVA
jgi:predicted phage terminase large subunit-like protein